MINNNKKFALAFNCLINFSFQRYQKLIKYFGNLENAFIASSHDLIQSSWKPESVFKFIKKRNSFNGDDLLSDLEKEKIEVCFIEDDNYPYLLKNIYSPPPILYYKGNLAIDWNNSLAVVGSRKFTYYGEKIAIDFVSTLASAGISIISGLAVGIDSLAHQETLKAGGQTIAVLGSGLDSASIYPRSNKKLADDIISNNGLILSEFPLKTTPESFNFPQRNRIIAGLARATLVIEASKKSGSLITAKYALDEGRDVLAVPGSIYDDNFLGNNNLIKSGAGVVLGVEDVFSFFNVLPFPSGNSATKTYEGENELERAILSLLRAKNHHIDELFEILPDDISDISSTLVVLEMRGFIRDNGGKNYEKV